MAGDCEDSSPEAATSSNKSSSGEVSSQMESPPRFGRTQTQCSTPVTTTSLIHCTLPTPVRNSIAGVKPKEADPYFDCERTYSDGLVRNIYRSVGPFSVDVPVEEVKRLIYVSEDGPKWKESEDTKDSHHRRSRTFRAWCEPIVPSHLALAFNLPILLKFSQQCDGNNKPRGRPRRHSLVVGMSGHCSAQRDGCPTTFICGFTEQSLKKLLCDSVPDTVELLMEVSNECEHVKGRQYGQLRGDARERTIEQYAQSKQAPTEFAKASLEKATDSDFHSSNRGATVTKGTAHNISRESKARKLAISGLTTCKLSNLMLSQRITSEQDRKARAEIEDSSTDVLGISRSVELSPYFRMHLWTKKSVQLFHRLSKSDRCIINVDSSGGLVNFPMVEDMKDKILHTMVAVSPKYAILDGQYTRDKTVSTMFSPLIVAEMVSNKNAGDDFGKFFKSFLGDRIKLFPNESPAPPLLCMTDCSPALQSGALQAFSSGDGMASTRIEYGNRILLHLLHYDKLVSSIPNGTSSGESRKETAVIILSSLKQNIGVFLKECKSHVYRAPLNWLKKHKGTDVVRMKSRFESVLKQVFVSLLGETRISEAIVQLSLVVAMFETEKFDSPSFDDTMETKECRGPTEIEGEKRLVRAIDDFLRRETSKLHVQSMEEVKDRLSDTEAIKVNHILLHVSTGIIDRAKSFFKKQCGMYLSSVSVNNDDSLQKMGTVRCSIVYGRSIDDDGHFLPWKEGGLDVMVKLPYNGSDGINNPLYSPTMSKYFLSTWMNKIPFWTPGVINVIENAKGMQIEDSNQFSEGVFRNVKHDTDVHNHVSEPAQYVLHRWEDTQRRNKQFIQQYEAAGGRIEELLNRRAKKRQRMASQDTNVAQPSADAPGSVVASAAAVSLTQDVLTQIAEEEEGEMWSRRGSQNEVLTKLRNELKEIFQEQQEAIGGASSTKQHAFVKHCLNSEKKFMSYATFNNFMTGKQQSVKGLKPLHQEQLREFIKLKRREPAAPDSLAVV